MRMNDADVHALITSTLRNFIAASGEHESVEICALYAMTIEQMAVEIAGNISADASMRVLAEICAKIAPGASFTTIDLVETPVEVH